MRLCGVQVRDDDCRTLVDLLMRVGRADDVALAGRLDRAIELETMILALSPAERDTLLGVLDDPPDSLTALRGKLARDQGNRQAS